MGSLLDSVLAKQNRADQIEAENENNYTLWRTDVYSELEVFIRRVKDLNVEDADDRSEFYEWATRLQTRLGMLRERDSASRAPTGAIIQLEDLANELEDLSKPRFKFLMRSDESLAKKRKRERRREEWEEEAIEQAREEIDEISAQIQDLLNALDGGAN